MDPLLENDAKLNALQEMETSTVKTLDPIVGWMDIDRAKISYSGITYPEKYRFQVKPVTTGTIKYFSTLDETNPMSVNDALTYVIENHVRILDGSRPLKPLEIIYEHDRFFFVMLVHAYSGAPTELSYKATCTHNSCKHVQDVSISPYNIQYTELSEKMLSSISLKTGIFNITTKTLGTRYYRPLSLSDSGELSEFMMASRRNGFDIEKFFLSVAPFLMHDRKPDETIDMIYQRYLKLTDNSTEISLLAKISDSIDIRQLLEIKVPCKKCRLDFRAPIQSVAGIKHIFLVCNIDDELS